MKKYGLSCCIKSHLLLVLLTLAMPALSATNCQLSNSPSGCPILVQATILTGCQISGSSSSTFGSINFGDVASLSNQSVVTTMALDSSITLNCTPNINLTISIDGGLYYDGNRNMNRTGGYIQPYQLYSDVGLTDPIGINQAMTIVTPTNGNNITFPIYAEMKLTNNRPPGSYSDTLTIMISW